MTVTFNLSDDKMILVTNALVSTSETITSLLEDTQSNNVTITVPVVYTSVFNYYFDFLNSIPIIINDVNTLLLCFKLESFFADNDFFTYLIPAAHMLWKDFYPHINELPDPRLMYLHAPYEFLPDAYIKRSTFFNEWIRLNQNKQITVNGDEMYYTWITTISKSLVEIDSDHVTREVDGLYTKYGLKDVWYTDINNQIKQLESQYRYKSTRDGYTLGTKRYFTHRDGLQQGCYKNRQLKYQEHYARGKKHGLQRAWYVDENGSESHHGGKLKYQVNIDSRTGFIMCETNFESGQLMSRNNYIDMISLDYIPQNLRDEAEKIEIYIDPMDKSVYGARHCLNQRWHINEQLEDQDNYVYGKLDGIQRTWSSDGHLIYKDLYYMDKFIIKLPLSE